MFLGSVKSEITIAQDARVIATASVTAIRALVTVIASRLAAISAVIARCTLAAIATPLTAITLEVFTAMPIATRAASVTCPTIAA